MSRLVDISLNGYKFESDDERLTRTRLEPAEERSPTYDQRYDFKTLIYDAFFEDDTGEVVLVCPSLRNFEDLLLKEAEILVDGAATPVTDVKVHGRGHVVHIGEGLKSAKTLSLRHELFSADIPISPKDTGLFEGLNAILSISKDNGLDWIGDWLKFYAQEHGAEAVLLFDNESTAYSMDALGEALTREPAIKKAVIVRAWVPFGPGGAGTVNHDSKFMHMMMFELARQRFLGSAAAVLNVDIDELVYARGDRTIFEAVKAEPIGYLRLNGKWAYPTPIPEGRPPVHADHRFVDKAREPVNRKWAVVPGKVSYAKEWKTHRILNTKDPTTPEFGFWHCRSISNNWDYDRTGWDQSTLVEDHRLCRTMTRVFGAPAAPPTIGRAAAADPKTAIGFTRRDGPYLLEWIAHHRAVGFDDFHIVSADEDDDSLALLKRLEETGAIRLTHRKVKRRRWLPPLLERAFEEWPEDWRGWMACLKISDFVNLGGENKTLGDVLSHVGSVDQVRFPVKTFGFDDQVKFEDQLLVSSKSRVYAGANEGAPYRTLFANRDGFEAFELHGPSSFYGAEDDHDAVDTSGARIFSPTDAASPDAGVVNSYRFRSVDSWLCDEMFKRRPGDAFKVAEDAVKALGGAPELDISIHATAAATKRELAKLKQDKTLKRLHKQAVVAQSIDIHETFEMPDIAKAREILTGHFQMEEGSEIDREIRIGLESLRESIVAHPDGARAERALEKLDRVAKILDLG